MNSTIGVGGRATFEIFATDYQTYAGAFTCQDLMFMRRQSATLLSRTRTLPRDVVQMVRARKKSNLTENKNFKYFFV